MIDRLKLSIPFLDKFLLKTAALSCGSVEYVDIEECSRRGITLEAKTVTYTQSASFDKYEISDLRHPYETLPTSYTGMAFKIFQGTPNRPACVEIKASPAKIIQGHNVYGSTCIHLGSSEMLMALYHVLPEFYEMLDVENTLLDLIDCTFSARLKNENQVKQVIEQLKNISNKQMRTAVRNEHETTCYFSRNSRHVDRKAYGKGFEFQRQLADLRSKKEQGCNSYDHVIEVMSCPHLQNFAQNLLRLEAGAKRRYLDEFLIPKKLVDAIKFQTEYEKDGNCLITDIWKRAFNPLLEALKGQKMNIFNDDEVHTQLKQQIKGQDQAIVALQKAIQATAAGLNNPNAPTGVFLFVGPSGVGKTQTALAIADLMYGGEQFLTTINMSEFQEKHTVSRLIGSPPGYVGYGEGGILTEAVRQRPYSVVLLDEVEKADPEVMNLFYQVFDKGTLNDGEGRTIDFKNTLIIMTSNLATHEIESLVQQSKDIDANIVAEAIRPTLNNHFKPALLARMNVLPFLPLNDEAMTEIIVHKLNKVSARLNKHHKLTLSYNDELVSFILANCRLAETGARNIDAVINRQLLPQLSTQLLAHDKDEAHTQIVISIDDQGTLGYVFS
jgi:II/X family phage/plasmid replication protein